MTRTFKLCDIFSDTTFFVDMYTRIDIAFLPDETPPGNAVLHQHAYAELHGGRRAAFWNPQLTVATSVKAEEGESIDVRV